MVLSLGNFQQNPWQGAFPGKIPNTTNNLHAKEYEYNYGTEQLGTFPGTFPGKSQFFMGI